MAQISFRNYVRLGLIWLCLGFPIQGWAAISFEKVCTPEEKWNVEIQDSDIAKIFSTVPENYGTSFTRIQALVTFRIPPQFNLTQQQITYLTHYWIWRSFLQMGLIHLAEEGFSYLAVQANIPQTSVIQAAALSCVYQLHKKYPSMDFSSHLVTALGGLSTKFLSSEVKEQVMSLAVSLLLKNLNQFSDPSYSAVQKLAFQSEPMRHLVQGIERANQEDRDNAVKSLWAFYKAPEIPKSLEKYRDMARLILGQILSDQNRRPQALAPLEAISPDSNWFSDAQLSRSWIYLNSGDYAKVLGSAYHFHLDGFKTRFAPEVLITSAMAFVETCHYPEAWQTLTLFNRNYRDILSWLKSNSLDHLYPVLTEAIKQKRKVPTRVISEWIISPTLVSGQDELNLVIDEQKRMAATSKFLSKYEASSQRAKFARMTETMRNLTKNVATDLAKKEVSLMAKIEADLKSRSLAMQSRLESLAETAQFVEIEVTNAGGEALLKEHVQGQSDKKEPTPLKQSDRSGKFQWGSKLAESKDDKEIWIDEIGLFQANIQNLCTN